MTYTESPTHFARGGMVKKMTSSFLLQSSVKNSERKFTRQDKVTFSKTERQRGSVILDWTTKIPT